MADADAERQRYCRERSCDAPWQSQTFENFGVFGTDRLVGSSVVVFEKQQSVLTVSGNYYN